MSGTVTGVEKTKAHQRRDDDIERVGRVAAERARVGERPDHLAPIPKRPRPAVRENDRNRCRTLAELADEVHPNAVDFDPMVRERIDLALYFTPVEFVDPVVDELFEITRADAVIPILIVEVDRPACGLQACYEIGEGAVRYGDDERGESARG